MHVHLCPHVCAQVLLMQWNSHFDWTVQQFHFVELFSGAAHTSKAWFEPQTMHIHLYHACMHCEWFRKKRGYNVGSYDIKIGEQNGAPTSHDFLTPAGFLPRSE